MPSIAGADRDLLRVSIEIRGVVVVFILRASRIRNMPMLPSHWVAATSLVYSASTVSGNNP
jgi:hypothetical protein